MAASLNGVTVLDSDPATDTKTIRTLFEHLGKHNLEHCTPKAWKPHPNSKQPEQA